MTTLTIALSDDPFPRLTELARDAGIPPEDLLNASVVEWLARPNDEFAQVAAYVLKNNAELYRRLA